MNYLGKKIGSREATTVRTVSAVGIYLRHESHVVYWWGKHEMKRGNCYHDGYGEDSDKNGAIDEAVNLVVHLGLVPGDRLVVGVLRVAFKEEHIIDAAQPFYDSRETLESKVVWLSPSVSAAHRKLIEEQYNHADS